MERKFLLSSFLVLVLLLGMYWGISLNGWNNGKESKAIENEDVKIQLNCPPRLLITSTFLGRDWISYTSKRLQLAECSGGGFTEIDDTITPDIVSTYYFVSALRAINQTPYNRIQTIEWLHRNEDNLFENTTTDYDANMPKFWIVYYGVMTLSMLNSSPKNPYKIIEFILNMRQKNGSFVYDDMDFTPQAVEILHVLGYNLSNLRETREYCLRNFQNLTPSHEYKGLRLMGFLFNFISYTKCLEIMGVNYTKTEEYKGDVSSIKNLSKNVGKILGNKPPLFIVANFAQLLEGYRLLNKTISEGIYNYVMSQELPDGGFNIFGKDYGEFQGTYYAVKTITLLGKKPDKKTIEFIHSWESPLGGFAFTFKKFCGPISTYMGVYVAKKIGMPLNRTRLETYLRHALHNRWPYSQDNPAALYPIYLTYKELNITIDHNDMKYLKNETIRLMQWYLAHRRQDLLIDEGWIDLIKLGNSIGVKLDTKTRSELISEILSMKNTNGTFGTGNTTGEIIFQTTNAVMLLHALGYNYNDTDTVQYFLRTMHGGGWGYPDLYNTYRVIEALVYMGCCPKDIQDLINFVHSLKYKYGGFLFYRGAKYYGGLQETYYALRILKLIGAIS
ncbi:hypothetical protein [Thermococcus sp.]|uniref:prenyltransferase/squalene oxidase repeat-containing protein n=1 Tax=Thermococcus sp. TaxID=35749 RepID=UPI00260C9B2F|nr:hypothetical protein [Thermococcus sp.]